MNKKIKTSDRGLTFAFNKTEQFDIGTAITYTVDLKSKKIIILPAGTGDKKASVSRKRSGSEFKPLLDLRSRDIKEVLKSAEYLNIEVQEDKILVSTYVDDSANTLQNKANKLGKKDKVIRLEEIIPVRKTSSFLLDKTILAKVSGGESLFSESQGCAYSTVNNANSSVAANFIEHTKNGIQKVFKVISLFSGAGMLDYPFAKDDAFEIVYAVDNDKSAVESYKHNIGKHIEHKSVANIKGSELPETDIIIGGVTCTPFSNANRHTRLKDHKDSVLLAEYIRLVKETDAQVFVMENVPQILTACEGEYFTQVLEELKDYEITAQLITDSEVGGCTKRKRAIVTGSKLGKISFPQLVLKGAKTVGQAIAKVTKEWFNFKDVTIPRADTVERMSHVPQGGNWEDIPESLRTGACNKAKKHSHSYLRLHLDRVAPAIVNWRKPPLIHPTENRTLTVAEASALSGFGVDFQFHGTLADKQQQCGNGVPYAIGKFVKNAIKKHLREFWIAEQVGQVQII